MAQREGLRFVGFLCSAGFSTVWRHTRSHWYVCVISGLVVLMFPCKYLMKTQQCWGDRQPLWPMAGLRWTEQSRWWATSRQRCCPDLCVRLCVCMCGYTACYSWIPVCVELCGPQHESWLNIDLFFHLDSLHVLKISIMKWTGFCETSTNCEITENAVSNLLSRHSITISLSWVFPYVCIMFLLLCF